MSDLTSLNGFAGRTFSFTGSELGKFKLEHVINRAAFIAPKVYGFETDKGETIIKVKGLTPDAVKSLTVHQLEALLLSNSSVLLNNEKTKRDMYSGVIGVLNSSYNLMASSSKRHPIYVEVGSTHSVRLFFIYKKKDQRRLLIFHSCVTPYPLISYFFFLFNYARSASIFFFYEVIS